MSKGPIRQLVPSLTSMIHLVATRECFGGSLELHVPPNHLPPMASSGSAFVSRETSVLQC